MDRKTEQTVIRTAREQRVSELKAEGKRDYVHTHGHGRYSVRDALPSAKDIMKRVKELGMRAVAVTDHGVAYGWIDYADKAKDAGVKFIPGVEIYETEDRTLHTRAEMVSNDYHTYHLVMLAITQEGYNNLIQIISEAGTGGKFDGKNRIDMNFIRDHNLGRGIRVTTACMGGRVPRTAAAGDIEKAIQIALEYREIFDEAYLEIQDSGVPDQEVINRLILDEIAPRSGLPIIINRDFHYIEPEHGDIHDTFKAIAYKKQKNSTTRGSGRYISQDAFYLGGPEEMWQYVEHNGIDTEAIYNGIELAEACTANVKLGGSFFPAFRKLPDGYSERTFLRKHAYEGLFRFIQRMTRRSKRYMLDVNQYIERLEYELGIIGMKGFDGYFLILEDIIDGFCKSHGISTGPGRGSAAGSLIAFVLGITKSDSIERDLMFERFLNPYRDSPPDIDWDIPKRHRYKVIQYVLDLYGEEFVSQVISYNTVGLRSGIRDIIKALGDDNDPNCIYTEDLAKLITNCIPSKMPDQSDIELSKIESIANDPDHYVEEWGEKKAGKVITQCQEFMRYMEQYPYVHSHMKVLEGSISSTGLHAAGVVICPEPIGQHLPVEYSKNDTAVLPVAGWDKEMVERAGFMKMDFLGLTTLDVLDITRELVERTTGEIYDVFDVDTDDEEVFRMISEGNTHGIFQISGGGLTSYVQQVKPQTMDDWCDVIALYRPGPLDAKVDDRTTFAQKYVENGEIDPSEYEADLHPALAKIYKRTRGVMVYQEQIMAVCQEVAGYSLGDADIFRRVVGKQFAVL